MSVGVSTHDGFCQMLLSLGKLEAVERGRVYNEHGLVVTFHPQYPDGYEKLPDNEAAWRIGDDCDDEAQRRAEAFVAYANHWAGAR